MVNFSGMNKQNILLYEAANKFQSLRIIPGPCGAPTPLLAIKNAVTSADVVANNNATAAQSDSDSIILLEHFDSHGFANDLHFVQLPHLHLLPGHLIGWLNVTQLKLTCFMQDFRMVFAISEVLPSVCSITLANEAICSGGNRFNTWAERKNKISCVKQLTLALNKENLEFINERPFNLMEFLLNTWFLLQSARKFFTCLELIDLVSVPYMGLKDVQCFGEQFPGIMYMLAYSPKEHLAFKNGTTLKMLDADREIVESCLRLRIPRPIKRKAEEMDMETKGMWKLLKIEY